MTYEQALVANFTIKKGNGLILNICVALTGALLLALLAQVAIRLPFTPVPITGQTFGVALMSLLWGRTRGTHAVLLYLAMGASGLPVFALGNSGLSWGPTCGYLMGMIVASYVMGSFADKGATKDFRKTLVVAYLGSAITFACGLSVLSFFVPGNLLLAAGLWPFLLGDCLKNITVSFMVTNLNRRHSGYAESMHKTGS